MRRLTLWFALAALAGAIAIGASAAVGGQHTSPVTATLGANVVTTHEQTCTGDDGQYRQAIETYVGGLGGDPRLTGVAALYLTSLTNTTTGNGTFAGVLVVTDPSTQAIKVRAALTGVSSGSSGITMNGLIVGHVQDFGTQPGGRLVANFIGGRNGTSLYGELGMNGPTARPAVIQDGHCGAPPTDRPAK